MSTLMMTHHHRRQRAITCLVVSNRVWGILLRRQFWPRPPLSSNLAQIISNWRAMTEPVVIWRERLHSKWLRQKNHLHRLHKCDKNRLFFRISVMAARKSPSALNTCCIQSRNAVVTIFRWIWTAFRICYQRHPPQYKYRTRIQTTRAV